MIFRQDKTHQCTFGLDIFKAIEGNYLVYSSGDTIPGLDPSPIEHGDILICNDCKQQFKARQTQYDMRVDQIRHPEFKSMETISPLPINYYDVSKKDE